MQTFLGNSVWLIQRANLSHDYFTNRQDRYIRIKNCEHLCDFFESIIDSLGQFSFKACANGECVYLNENNSEHPFNGAINDFSNSLSNRLKDVISTYNTNNDINPLKSQSDAFIYPLIQINDCGIRTEELVTEKLFKLSPISSRIYLAVGYFNLTKNYIDFIVEHSGASYRILLSSPQANGFFGSNGFSNNIPSIYSYLEEEFFNNFSNLNQENRISLHEYKRDNWSNFFFNWNS